MIGPRRQLGQFLLSGSPYGPAPGLEEGTQVLLHGHREGLGVEVHLALLVLGDVGHVVVGGEHSLKGSPAKCLLELRR